MRYRITNHSDVVNDFATILKFIGEYSGYPTARGKVVQIKQSISGLKTYPHIGTVRDDIALGLRAIPSAEKATICFTVDEEIHTVKIVCVTYAGQDWQAIARDRQ